MPHPRIITAQARSWLGTRFHHQGRLKATVQHKGGCDCIGFILGVAGELGIISKQEDRKLLNQFDEMGYSRVPDGLKLKHALQQHLHEIPVSDIRPGDVLLFYFDTNPQHVAIATDYSKGLGIIHCYLQARKVVEHRLDSVWRERMVSAFRFEGI